MLAYTVQDLKGDNNKSGMTYAQGRQQKMIGWR